MQDTDRHTVFTAPGGSKFRVRGDNTGLYYIDMLNGGLKPKMCEERFTATKLAERAIKQYINAKTTVPRKKNKAKDVAKSTAE